MLTIKLLSGPFVQKQEGEEKKLKKAKKFALGVNRM